MYERCGPVKTEEDPLASRPPSPSSARSPAAITHVDTTVPLAAPEGIVLRYGGFYGRGPRIPCWTAMTGSVGDAETSCRTRSSA
jgi:hypothetical protein